MDKLQEISNLNVKYPNLGYIRDSFYHTSVNNYIELDVKSFLDNINDMVLEHNKALELPAKGKHKKDIEKVLVWLDYNTPNTKDTSITPLYGTGFIDGIDSKSSYDVFSQWEVSTYMLILEYNYLNKAWIYLNNKESTVLSNKYKEFYIYWKQRQILALNDEINLFSIENKADLGLSYVKPIWLDGDCINNEIAEDLLYVLLNILLAKSILTNTKVKNYINNDKLFFKQLESVIGKHYIKYHIEYQCIYELRRYKCYNSISLHDLNSFILNNK
jgi:hypothetical protein